MVRLKSRKKHLIQLKGLTKLKIILFTLIKFPLKKVSQIIKPF